LAGFNRRLAWTTGAQLSNAIDPVTGILVVSGSAAWHYCGKKQGHRSTRPFFFDGWGTKTGTIDSALISPADGTALTEFPA